MTNSNRGACEFRHSSFELRPSSIPRYMLLWLLDYCALLSVPRPLRRWTRSRSAPRWRRCAAFCWRCSPARGASPGFAGRFREPIKSDSPEIRKLAPRQRIYAHDGRVVHRGRTARRRAAVRRSGGTATCGSPYCWRSAWPRSAWSTTWSSSAARPTAFPPADKLAGQLVVAGAVAVLLYAQASRACPTDLTLRLPLVRRWHFAGALVHPAGGRRDRRRVERREPDRRAGRAGRRLPDLRHGRHDCARSTPRDTPTGPSICTFPRSPARAK